MTVDHQIKSEFNQNTIEGIGDGICSGLVQVWTSIKLNEVADNKRKTSEERIKALKRMSKINIATTIHIGGGFGNIDQRISGNEKLGLKEKALISPLDVAYNDYWLNNAGEKLCKAGKRTCFHLVVRVAGSGNHSLGLYLSAGRYCAGIWGQHVYFFDPNYGEYKIDKSKLNGWLSEFFKEKYQPEQVEVLGLFAVSLLKSGCWGSSLCHF